MDLVILAGGIGSRFGGLKQIEPIDNNGNFIIDYSVFDAIRAGFNRIVFVIKRENLQDFKNSIGKRLEKKIKVEYAFQDMDSFVDTNIYNVSSRTKPFGTAHAILCAKNFVKTNFAIINADDFYGKTSFEQIYKFLNNNSNKNCYAMVGYNVINTISENGEVKRGICKLNSSGNLVALDESVIKVEGNKLLAKSLGDNANNFNEISKNTLVSMNLFGFPLEVFDLLEKGFYEFLENNKNNLTSCEYFIPTILTENIAKNKINIKVLETSEEWFGLTYKSDFDFVKRGINKLTEKNIYPKNLWNN